MKVTRDFSLSPSVLDGSTGALGGPVSMPIYVTTTTANGTKWDGGPSIETPVALSWDPASFSDCGLDAAVESIGVGSITFSATSVTPTAAGALSTLTINTTGLSTGCYLFTLRAYGTNGDGQPVTHLETVRFTVATTADERASTWTSSASPSSRSPISPRTTSSAAPCRPCRPIPMIPSLVAQRARLVPWS